MTDPETIRILLTGYPARPGGSDPGGAGSPGQMRRLARLATDGSNGSLSCSALPLWPKDRDHSLLKLLEVIDHELFDGVLILEASSTDAEVSTRRYAYNRVEPVAVPAPRRERPAGDSWGPIRLTSGDPIDPSGPEEFALGAGIVGMVERMRKQGIKIRVTSDPSSAACNLLSYGILRYVSLRGRETWFRRQPPAGLSTVTGMIRVPDREASGSSPPIETLIPAAIAAFASAIR